MANGNILSLIAQPQVANVVGQFGAGQETGRINRLRQQAQQVGQLPAGQQQNEALRRLGTEDPETAAKINELFAGLDQQNITSAAFDIAGALSVGGEQQAALLRGALPKVASNNLFTTQIQEILNLPQEQRDERLINAVQTFRGLGFLPGAEEAATAGQREFASLTQGLTEEDREKARRVSLGLDPRAVGSAVQTITAEGTAVEVAETEAVIAQRKKFAEMTGSSRASAIDKGFDKVQNLTKNIRNIGKAIDAVRAGAGTGVITRRFPSVRGSSVLLDQIQGELALDVIGSVTFGALSEGELTLAKQIALPTGLEGETLIKHLQDRQAAQTKLMGYFQDQIDFLDQGGSVAGFLRSKRRDSTGAPQQQAGQPAPVAPGQVPNQVLTFDAQGNLVQ